MRWEDEKYVKVYTRDTADWIALTWEARAVFGELMRKVDRAGMLPLGKSGWRGVAGLLRIPADVVERAAAELLADGCVVERDGSIILPNFMQAQDAIQGDRARQQKSREVARARSLASQTAPAAPLPTSHEDEPPVTPRHAASRDVTERHSYTICADPISDPPNPPKPGGAGTGPDPAEPRRQASTAELHRLGEVYAETVRDRTGAPFGLPRGAVRDLAIVANDLAPQGPVEARLEWFAETVGKFIAATKNDPIANQGFRPSRFVDWLNAGAPPTWGRKQGTDPASAQPPPYHREWTPTKAHRDPKPENAPATEERPPPVQEKSA